MGNGVFFFFSCFNPVLEIRKKFLLSVLFLLTLAWLKVREAILNRLVILSITIFRVFSETSGSRVTCCMHVSVFIKFYQDFS